MWGWSWSSIPITTRNQTARMQLKGSKYHTFGCRNLGFGYEATTRKGYNIPKTNGWKAGTSPKNGGLYIFPFQKIPVGPFSGFQRWVFGGLSQVFYHHILHLVTAYHTSKTGMASPIAGGVLAAWYMKTINLWNGQGFQKKKFIEKSTSLNKKTHHKQHSIQNHHTPSNPWWPQEQYNRWFPMWQS